MESPVSAGTVRAVRLLSLFLALTSLAAAAAVRVEEVPEGAVQPQVMVGGDGTAHLIYLKGEPGSCDVRWVRRRAEEGARWSAPVAVNSQPATAVAMGTIRGAQMALGRGGTIHVVWNGASVAAVEGQGVPLFLQSLGAGAEQLRAATESAGSDGGAGWRGHGRGR